MESSTCVKHRKKGTHTRDDLHTVQRERERWRIPSQDQTHGFTYPIMQVEELKDVVRRRAPRNPPVVLAGFSAGLGLSTSGMHATNARPLASHRGPHGTDTR